MLTMPALVSGLNAALTGLFDLALRPLAPLGPLGALSVFAALVGVALAWLFEELSPAEKRQAARSRVEGQVIALRLYQHSPGIFLRLQVRIMLDLIAYLRQALVPISVLALLSIPLLIQLEGRYGQRPLRVGERTLVTARLASPASVRLLDQLALEAPAGLAVESLALRVPALGEATWRVRALGDGVHTLRLRVAGVEATKTVHVGSPGALVSNQRARSAFQQLLHPGEPPFEGGVLAAIEVRYPDRGLALLGRSLDWLAVFLVVSIAVGQGFRVMFAASE